MPKSILMTPDPYHTPGYGGFCPQFEYQIGATFGRTTSDLLTNKKVASSGRLVLANIDPSKNDQQSQRESRVMGLRNRTQSYGDQKMLDKMVPGYTGYIPKGQHYFGSRYAENSLNAQSDFELSRRKRSEDRQELRDIASIQSGRMKVDKTTNPKLLSVKFPSPLKAIAKDAKPYISQNAFQPAMSPYYMDNSNPQKSFISGYTGFVPHILTQMSNGHPYPINTHHALNSFTDDMKLVKNTIGKSVTVERKEPKTEDSNPIYRKETGQVPHYTGHVPGEKFRYGNTFGHSTTNARRK
ncbi:unnamed protein product [Owenia fusiformis]|uniref:Ciliary microtubule inner protein 2A-C-like domain-containing protein n=1 Tax=Owenia fusiformis TaxID=6347 RepID=A0A8S4P1N5_OWEFU|nr:unnamed protein product [Owenia fusiformis]